MQLINPGSKWNRAGEKRAEETEEIVNRRCQSLISHPMLRMI
jgi:hypothetical protein